MFPNVGNNSRSVFLGPIVKYSKNILRRIVSITFFKTPNLYMRYLLRLLLEFRRLDDSSPFSILMSHYYCKIKMFIRTCSLAPTNQWGTLQMWLRIFPKVCPDEQVNQMFWTFISESSSKLIISQCTIKKLS